MNLHRNWIQHHLTNSASDLFSPMQLSELRKSLNTAEIIHFTETVLQQLGTLEDQSILEWEQDPFKILLLRFLPHTILALHSKLGSSELPVDMEQGNLLVENHFIARSNEMKYVLDIIKKVSYVDSTILLLGKSGVGKSALAKLIHNNSSRTSAPFVSINCGAIPDALMEAELFGYSHGSFTGGQKGGKKGLFEAANGGTIFLDEIGELPLNLQVKLLQVLQESCIRRIGSSHSLPIDVRIIAATNQDLADLVEQKRFREDLYYRLNVVPIEIPSLSKRKEDIRELTSYFLKKYTLKHGVQKYLNPDVIQAFVAYDWPGNVRELENMVERLIITVGDTMIQQSHLPAPFQSLVTSAIQSVCTDQGFVPLKQAKKIFERELILRAYDTFQNMYKVAEVLEVDQSTISKKIKEYRSQ